jgi:hypothetical protein
LLLLVVVVLLLLLLLLLQDVQKLFVLHTYRILSNLIRTLFAVSEG